MPIERSKFKILIQNWNSKFRFKIQNSSFKFKIQILNSKSKFGFKIQILIFKIELKIGNLNQKFGKIQNSKITFKIQH